MDSLLDDLLVELECPICSSYMSPPIHQCSTGHSVCESCRKKLTCCALCQENFTESRNISLEGLAVKMRYPCVHRLTGCTATLSYNEREIHELRCTFKGVRCAMEKCTWIGQVSDLKEHWASKKVTSKPYQASNFCHAKMKQEFFYVNLVDALDKLFWFKCKLINRKLYWAVQYIGKFDEADNYYYEIEIFRQGRTKRKIFLSDYCQSLDLNNSDLFKLGSCVCIHTELIEHFVCDDQLVYYMRVHPVNTKVSSTFQKTDGSNPSFSTPLVKKHRDRSKGPQLPNKNKELKIKKPKGVDKNDENVVV